MSLKYDQETANTFRPIISLWFMYRACQMLYRLWLEWQANALAFPIRTMPLILGILGPVASIGIWKKWTPAYWIGAAIFIGMPVNLFLTAQIPSNAPMKDILKCVLYVSAGYYLWEIRNMGDLIVQRRMKPEFEALLKKIQAETSYPQGRISLVLKSAGQIDMNWLKGCVCRATGRVCTVSDAVNNIDLGAEVGCLQDNESLVGGSGSFAIIGLRGVSIEMRILPCSISDTGPVTESGLPQESSGLMILSVMYSRAVDPGHADGFQWLAPLAIECWTEDVRSATVVNRDGQETPLTCRIDLLRLAMSAGWDAFGTLSQLNPECA